MIAAMENYDDWLPMAEVTALTGMSERTIYRMVAEGKLRQSRRPIPGRRPLPVFDPDNVAELAQSAIKARPLVDPPARIQETNMEPLRATVGMLAEALHAATFPPMAELSRKVYLTIAEARRYSGLSAEIIQRAAKDGLVRKLGRLYRRKDLEEL